MTVLNSLLITGRGGLSFGLWHNRDLLVGSDLDLELQLLSLLISGGLADGLTEALRADSVSGRLLSQLGGRADLTAVSGHVEVGTQVVRSVGVGAL